jgi:hypothetical protein
LLFLLFHLSTTTRARATPETPMSEARTPPKPETKHPTQTNDRTNMSKTLDNTSIADAKTKVSDIKATGNGDAWQLLGKAKGEHVAEAVAWVPGVTIAPDVNNGRKLVPACFNGAPTRTPGPTPTT